MIPYKKNRLIIKFAIFCKTVTEIVINLTNYKNHNYWIK